MENAVHRLTIRLSRPLAAALSDYQERAELSAADAARKLIETGLAASQLDGFDAVRALVGLQQVVSELRDQVATVAADTYQAGVQLDSLTASSQAGTEHLDALRGWADGWQCRSRPLLEMLCELYMVGRLFTKKKYPDDFSRLHQLADQQLEIFEERAAKALGQRQGPAGAADPLRSDHVAS